MLVASRGARADVLVAVRPGVMCTSAEALARLTLPDGSSRTAARNPRPGDLALKAAGGCLDIPYGARVTVSRSYTNTSVGTYDAGDGSGRRQFIIPNIDFRPLPDSGEKINPSGRRTAPPPQPDTVDFLFSALEQACPEKNWRGAPGEALESPLRALRAAHPPAQAEQLSVAVAERCPRAGDARCASETAILFMLRTDRLGPLLGAYCAADPG